MMNFHNRKNQKIISSVIIIILVLAMIVPTLVSFLYARKDLKNESI